MWPPRGQFQTGAPLRGAEWTEMDIDYLKAAISIEEAAHFLRRADSVEDVRRKCQ
jgi:hypothetical protein